MSFWPQRFTTDDDADEVITLLRRVREEGGRHVAIMAHLGHHRELSTPKVEPARGTYPKEAFATIRSQTPIMRGINDDAEVWREKWRKVRKERENGEEILLICADPSLSERNIACSSSSG